MSQPWLKPILVKATLERARQSCVASEELLLIEWPDPVLPGVACIAELESDALSTDEWATNSSVVVVWFQHQFDQGLPKEVVEFVRELNWDTKAAAWSW